MGSKQSAFLDEFRRSFVHRFGETNWTGGQVAGNKASFNPLAKYRRNEEFRANEGIELGDLVTQIGGFRLVIEFESEAMIVQNLIKYWPFLRGELDVTPTEHMVMLHFSDWRSWGSYRDLWEWIRERICNDADVRVDVSAEQFDHGGENTAIRTRSIGRAIDFVEQQLNEAR